MRAPPSAGVRAFPVVKKHRLIWVWPGRPELADPGLVPDLHRADDPEWSCEGASIEIVCDYRLLVDNLMDLTHETYVHSPSIGRRASSMQTPDLGLRERAIDGGAAAARRLIERRLMAERETRMAEAPSA